MLSATELTDMAATQATTMADKGTITRDAGSSLNRTTGNSTATTPTTIYNGVMHVRTPDALDVNVLFGDTETTKQRYMAILPGSITVAETPQHDDVLTLTAASAAYLVGVPMRVTFVTGGTYNLGPRCTLEVIDP